MKLLRASLCAPITRPSASKSPKCGHEGPVWAESTKTILETWRSAQHTSNCWSLTHIVQ